MAYTSILHVLKILCMSSAAKTSYEIQRLEHPILNQTFSEKTNLLSFCNIDIDTHILTLDMFSTLQMTDQIIGFYVRFGFSLLFTPLKKRWLPYAISSYK